MTADILIIFALLVANGVFAMAEIALVASRRIRLEQHAAGGHAGAVTALRLKAGSTDFLSTAQVGITLIGIFAGAYSGSTLAEPLAAALAPLPGVGPYADTVAFAVVVSALTYFSLVIGELVPKAIALRAPERMISLVAQPFAALARVASPLVRLLSASTTVVLWILRIKPVDEPHPTEEEIRALMKQATRAGEIEPVEQKIVERMFHLGDRRVSSLMTPRPDIDWVDADANLETIRAQFVDRPHSRVVVCDGELDKVVGVAYAVDLLTVVLQGKPIALGTLARQPLFVPETITAFLLLERLQAGRTHTAIVVDEYGAVQGLVTLTDLLEGLVGALPDRPVSEPGPIVQRADGSWLVDGSIPIDELRGTIPLPDVEAEEEGAFDTLAGLIMTRLSRLPRAGDSFEWGGLRFEVIDMDDRRVDKVLVSRVAAAASS